MRIVRASFAQMPAIRRLIRANPGKLLQENLPRAGEFFVAKDEKGRVMGCCALAVYSKRLAEIRSLAVDEAHQGKGIGTALIERCLAEARKKKIYEVLTVTSEKALFAKQGFDTFNEEKYALLKVLGRS
jgi:amino-acid N-acetyltransferase